MVNQSKSYFILVFLVLSSYAKAQEIQIFKLSDFDLRNRVKSCLVSTDYGKEEYDFNKKGFLTKSVTRYSETDYDVVYYRFVDSLLTEKSSESYRDNIFDPSTSIAHFYARDTTNNLTIQERIFSYDKEFLDEFVYQYDESGDLISIQHVDNDGTDETLVEYKKYKGEDTVTYFLNGVPLKSVRTSIKRPKNKPEQQVVLTKEFLKGEENFAFEEVFNASGKLFARQEFEYDVVQNKFVPTIRTSFSYNEQGMLISETTKTATTTATKEYIYQFDKQDDGNWIKQIITPDNTYKTRKIEYYKASPAKSVE